MAYQSTNPATGEELKTYPEATCESAMDSLKCAHDAFTSWRRTSFSERKKILLSLAETLREREAEFGRLITLEMGKRISEACGEIKFCAEILEFYANGAEEFLADHDMDVEGAKAFIQYEPIGPLLGVMPWNFPFYQVIRFAAPNLMAGNTVLIKHAGRVPQCAETIERLFSECGLPEGIYTNLFVSAETVESLIKSDLLAGVSLTGSEKAGASVAETAGKNLKKTVLELGGNDVFIVLEDADLDEVVKAAVKGRMVNNGQSCVASKRFILVGDIGGPFLSKFKEALAGMTMGDPMDENTDLGPLSSEEAAQGLAEQVRKGVEAGATLVLGGKRPDCEGAFYEPTILTDVTPDMPNYDEELFGPVATVYFVESEEEAVILANDSSYGLGGSIYTKDIERGRNLAGQIDTGMVFLNQPTNSQAELPFGGTKRSGHGRELSKLGILEFVNKKLVHLGAD